MRPDRIYFIGGHSGSCRDCLYCFHDTATQMDFCGLYLAEIDHKARTCVPGKRCVPGEYRLVSVSKPKRRKEKP